MGGFFSLLKRQPHGAASEQAARMSLLPAPGGSAPCLLSHQGELIHAICKIKDRREARVLLRVLKEMGKIPLFGLQIGSLGRLEVDGHLLSFQITEVQLPWLVVVLLPEHPRPAHRQLLRIPATFSVRLRQQTSTGPWRVGKGLNLSSGGFCFAFYTREQPQPGTLYLAELTLHLTRLRTETLETMTTEVRWVSSRKETLVGVRVIDPARQKDLANAVSQLQRFLIRQPEDYMLIENPQPRLR